MSDIEVPHKQIDRPKGISGYKPSQWCSVCGKASRGDNAVKCVQLNCLNLCHNTCLADLEHFNCNKVTDLRNSFDIAHPVVYIEEDIHNIETEDTQEETLEQETQERNDLKEKCKEELIEVILKLRKEATESRALTSNLKRICKTIASKRDALVEALEFVDTLTATVDSIDETAKKSIACSAIPHRIDEEWQKKVETNPQLDNWWQKEKPKRVNNNQPIPTQTLSRNTETNCNTNSNPLQVSSEVTPQVRSIHHQRPPTDQVRTSNQNSQVRTSNQNSQVRTSNQNSQVRTSYQNSQVRTSYQNSHRQQPSSQAPRKTYTKRAQISCVICYKKDTQVIIASQGSIALTVAKKDIRKSSAEVE